MNNSYRDVSRDRRSIDLNADLGEGFPHDEALLDLVTSASICCNAHAGSADVIRRTLSAAAARGVAVGAHPGYRDREGFGRREREMSCDEIRELILDQVGFLNTLAAEAGVTVRFLKPHGALYNQAQRHPEIARGVIASVGNETPLPLVGQPDTLLDRLAASRAIPFVPEGFPDRRYQGDGSLVPRSEPRAVIEDPIEMEAHALRLLRAGRVATLCIHGDDPRAVNNATLVRRILTSHGILLRSFLDEPI